jgi:hypothetical protein
MVARPNACIWGSAQTPVLHSRIWRTSVMILWGRGESADRRYCRKPLSDELVVLWEQQENPSRMLTRSSAARQLHPKAWMVRVVASYRPDLSTWALNGRAQIAKTKARFQSSHYGRVSQSFVVVGLFSSTGEQTAEPEIRIRLSLCHAKALGTWQ